MEYYGTVSGGDSYFGERLHTDTWTASSSGNKLLGLKQATRLIDNLNYKGVKAPVWSLLYNSDGSLVSPKPDRDDIITADLTQELEFPRGEDTSVPDAIVWAAYEIAYALLDGVDPEAELSNLRVKQNVYAAVRTTYADGYESVEHILNGVPSATAWRWLKPFLDDDNSIHIRRVN